ncbi:MAG: D-alanyl-D-alanine carboxypeptidase [Deltaproteobacteria bacterium]|nr:D-alanyl-D-alanine carboxypeptidase [Deltaproteobacteria bacterium]
MFPFSSFANQDQLEAKIKQEIQNGCVFLQDENEKTLLSVNPDQVFIPASIIKVLTSQAALDLLGENYRFKTEFYQDNNENIMIKGYGDPYLISEEIHLIALEFKKLGITEINRLYLDSSSFEGPMDIHGTNGTLNPYDAINGALVVNFNTLNLYKDKFGEIISGEEATPLTPLATEKGLVLKPGTKDRLNLTDNPAESLRYVGELFAEIFILNGIKIQNPNALELKVGPKWEKILTYENSHELKVMLTGLLKYSNNFIANQLYLTLGAQKKGYPATLGKSKSVFNDYSNQLIKPSPVSFQLEEASGISRKDRANCSLMMKVLNIFKNNKQLLDHKKGVYLKSGTLDGVYNYAGYINSQKGLRSFVIILNQPSNRRDRILNYLIKYSQKYP